MYMKPESMLDVRYEYIWAFHIAFNTGFSTYVMNLNKAQEHNSPADIVFFDITDREVRYDELTPAEQTRIDQVLADN